MNGPYKIAGNCGKIPNVEVWTGWINEAPPDTALKLRQHAIGCLAQSIQNQRWGVLIGIAEGILSQRKIDFQ